MCSAPKSTAWTGNGTFSCRGTISPKSMEQVFFSSQVGATIKCSGGTGTRLSTAREVIGKFFDFGTKFCQLHSFRFPVTLTDLQITFGCLGIATDESNGILYCTTSSMVSFGEFITDC